jgi:hypothetical protein
VFLSDGFADIGSGIVLLFDARLSALPQLRFLRRLATQIAPAMYSVYLLRRLRSRVGALERARIATATSGSDRCTKAALSSSTRRR